MPKLDPKPNPLPVYVFGHPNDNQSLLMKVLANAGHSCIAQAAENGLKLPIEIVRS